MNAFRKLFTAIITLMILLAAALNIFMIKHSGKTEGTYRVEAKRIADEINETGSFSPEKYPHITGVYSGEIPEVFVSNRHYVMIEAGGSLWRVEYATPDFRTYIAAADITIAAFFALVISVLLYLKRKLIAPFGQLNDVPKELAKGNLAVELPEEKSRFFGKFTWGVNLLREKIEEDRRKELSMQRDKKLLLLSLSHDIKTPLSAIKLNAKALAKGLYSSPEKRTAAAESINARADEIERFVSEITKAASEDFMSFEIVPGEEFLSRIIDKISARYAPQLTLTGTRFEIGKFDDAILSCDPDRLGECLQNLIENAVKYGDGKLIAISFEKMDGCELITVENTGCTLEPPELTQIFSSFHRGSNAENIRGNGLGLFICRKLMTLMGGEAYADIDEGRFRATLVVKLA